LGIKRSHRINPAIKIILLVIPFLGWNKTIRLRTSGIKASNIFHKR
jgi:hypothetical protein